MYPVTTISLRENSTIPSDLYDQQGNILLLQGTRLKPRILEFLRQRGFDRVFLLTRDDAMAVTDALDDACTVADLEADNLEQVVAAHTESGTIPREIVLRFYEETGILLDSVLGKSGIDIKPVETVITEIVDLMCLETEIDLGLNDLIFFKGGLASHSTNVALISLFAAHRFNLTRSQLVKMALGAVLHDVGFKDHPLITFGQIPRSRLEGLSPKPIATHPETGCKLLKRKGIDDEAVLDIVYHHHERYDGLGYPDRLREDEIPLTSSIVTLANDFVTLSGIGDPGELRPGSKAIRQMLRDIGKAYNPYVAREFIGVVGIYPVGSILLLSSGATGIVVGNPSGNVLTPRLMLTLNTDGEEILKPKYLDLAESDRISVRKVLTIG